MIKRFLILVIGIATLQLLYGQSPVYQINRGPMVYSTWGPPTPAFPGVISISLDGSVGISRNGIDYNNGIVLQNSIFYFKELSRGGFVGNIACGQLLSKITSTASTGSGANQFFISAGTYTDNVNEIWNGSGGYSSEVWFRPSVAEPSVSTTASLAMSFVPSGAPAVYGGGAMIETNDIPVTNPPPNIGIFQYQDNGSGPLNHRVWFADGTNQLSNTYGWSNTTGIGPIGIQTIAGGYVGIKGVGSADTALNINGGTPNTDYGANGKVVANLKGDTTNNSAFTPVMIDAPTGSLPLLDYLVNGVRKFELQMMATSGGFGLYEQGASYVWSYAGGGANFTVNQPFATAGTASIGGGSPIAWVKSATATLDFASTIAGASTDLTITITGATVGDSVEIGAPNGSVPAGGAFFGWVSATNTVSIRYFDNSLVTSYDPASGTFRATVTHF